MTRVAFNGSKYQIEGDLPELGSRASDFMLVDGELRDTMLAEWSGQRKLLNVFPSIDTEVCAASVRRFEESAREREDVTMLMISMDLPFAQTRFREEQELEAVVMLSGLRSDGFGETYGVGITEGPLKGLFARAVIVLDENNSVVHTELVDDIGDEPDYKAALKALGGDE